MFLRLLLCLLFLQPMATYAMDQKEAWTGASITLAFARDCFLVTRDKRYAVAGPKLAVAILTEAGISERAIAQWLSAVEMKPRDPVLTTEDCEAYFDALSARYSE